MRQVLSGSILLCFSIPMVYGADAGVFLQDVEKQQPIEKRIDDTASLPTRSSELSKPSDSDIKVYVTEFQISGNSTIATEEIEQALKSLTYQNMTYNDLIKALRIVDQIYLDHGHMARVIFPPQEINNGVIKILVLEGTLSQVFVEDVSGKDRSGSIVKYVESSQKIGEKISVQDVERAILLINDTPGIKAVSAFEAGQKSGESVLNIKIDETEKFQGNVFINNYGSRSTGNEQINLYTNVNSPFSLGDKLTVYLLASEGMKYGRGEYSVPVGFNGLRVGANVSYLDYEADSVNEDGDAATVGVNGSYPLYRTRTGNVELKFAVDQKNYQNKVESATISDKDITLATASISAVKSDNSGEWNFFSAVSYGRVDLSDNPSNLEADRDSVNTQGNFWKGYASMARYQDITDNVRFIMSLSGQISNKNLDSSEKMYLGGPFGVRAYPVNEAGGDMGYLGSLELHYRYQNYDFGVFTDYGHILQNHTLYDGWDAAGSTSNGYSLSGQGISFEYFRNLWHAKMTASWKNGSNPNPQADGSDNDGTNNQYQVYFSLNRGF